MYENGVIIYILYIYNKKQMYIERKNVKNNHYSMFMHAYTYIYIYINVYIIVYDYYYYY